MKARLNEGRISCTFLTILCMTSLSVLVSLPSANAAPTVGGNNILPRETRDGAYDISFVDMTHTIQSTCSLTGWNIWARSYAVNWPSSTAPRSLKLTIFRLDGTNLNVVGKSELETVSEWNRAYHFDLTTLIPVQAGDLIGWYFPSSAVPGGSISFGLGSGSTRWSYAGEVFGSTPLATFSRAANRVYSINVEGDITPSIPVPGAIFLGTFGMSLVSWMRRRRML